MEERIGSLLPIGSVVTLKEGTKKLMIFGIIQSVEKPAEGTDVDSQEYDYIGVPYPEGNINQDYQYSFNHEDIETIHFFGYQDVERQIFISELQEFYRNGLKE